MKSGVNALAILEKMTQRKVTLGNYLWSIRKCEEMTQADFAALIGVSTQYLCDIENARRFVSPKLAAEFAKKLGYSAVQFVRLAVQDQLNGQGLYYDVRLLKKAA